MESDFIDVNKKKGTVTVKINPDVFPIDLIYEASYSIMGRAFVILDGNPSDTIYAILKPRTFKGELNELGREFYDELVSSAYYAVQLVRNKDIRDAMMKGIASVSEAPEQVAEIDVPDDEDFSGDEEEIAKLWEDKFGSEEKDDCENCEEEGK